MAHLGDSRVLRVKCVDEGFEHEQITTDHKPDERNEKSESSQSVERYTGTS